MCDHKKTMTHDYLHYELNKRNKLQEGNRLNELIDTYATFYGNKDPAVLDTYSSKII